MATSTVSSDVITLLRHRPEATPGDVLRGEPMEESVCGQLQKGSRTQCRG